MKPRRGVRRAGARLRQLREQLGLTMRDVQAQSEKIAARLRQKAFVVRISRLSEFERSRSVPNIHQLYSLASVYECGFRRLLSWYGIPFRPR